jgi:hypothetical protein
MNDIEEKVIKDAKEIIRAQLKRKNISQTDRSVFFLFDGLFTFLDEDHKKISEMYPVFLKQQEQGNRWEPRAWDVFKSAVLIIVGYGVSLL